MSSAIEDEFEPRVLAAAIAAAAFDNRDFETLTDFVKRHYLEKAEFSLGAADMVGEITDRDGIVGCAKLFIHLNGK